jgi:hypothetical protein
MTKKNDLIIQGKVNETALVTRLVKTMVRPALGVAEMCKNCNAEMDRLKKSRAARDIVIFFKKINSKKTKFGILDFGGMTRDTIKNNLFHWLDDSVSGGSEFEGGHGNGGKIFALQYFSNHKWCSFKANKYNEVRLNDYKKDANPTGGRYIHEPLDDNSRKVESCLDNNLSEFDLDLKKFKELCIDDNNNNFITDMFEDFNGYTFFVGETNIDGKSFSRVSEMCEQIVLEPQAYRTLKSSDVSVFNNGKLFKYDNKTFLQQLTLEPKPGFEQLTRLQVPEKIEDTFTRASNNSELILRTSKIQLKNSRKQKKFRR